ncbi:pilus (MSHA type) biogenesis protein MshL [Motilimonas cestriensis]|uniref:Pilus (MSHA type) biogenesis protein MshL n=1 Tax=Motilimonas cestriensis TaxID=2742685 RepID=A0ABS8WCN8_9GAMM|nr:pilus (MSHA type) biogenesis protein MshL [Motilimonas cestriensis]MCE2596033.1 pilus (MSHA type) biogenesis protein MshL [Motilimonas cestriensis]
MKNAALMIFILALAGCKTTETLDAKEQKEALNQSIDNNQQQPVVAAPITVPDTVLNELLPETDLTASQQRVYEKRFQVSANNVEANQFFGSLVQDTPFSMAIHPGVDGYITLNLKDVTLDEVLSVAKDMYGYDIQRKGRIYHIYPSGMRVETFPMNYLLMDRDGATKTTVATGHLADQNSSNGNSTDSGSNTNGDTGASANDSNGGNTNGTQITTRTKTAYWQSLENALVGLVGSDAGRKVVINPMAGLVTVRAYPDELKMVGDFLKQAEQRLQRQVILETQIIEVVLDDNFQQGITWNTANDVRTSDYAFSSIHKIADNVIRNTIGGGGALTITNGDFSAVISLLETQGDVNVLSKPRITATNNQKAVIKVGNDEYFVTNISTTTVTGNATTSTPNVELTPFFSGISLDVTPQIDGQGGVLLHVHPSIIDIEEQQKKISFRSSSSSAAIGSDDDLIIPVAKSEVRESDTIVKAQSNDVIVIGGLMKTLTKDLISKTPLLGDIPWFGELFTNRSKQTFKTELVILLKPTVVVDGTWQQELERSSTLLEKWYPAE